jgi:hypothetical protein
MKRRTFIGAASVGAVAATVGSTRGFAASDEGGYDRVRPTVTFGVGKGQAVSISVVWLPTEGREQLPPIKVRLVIFELGGKPLVDKEVLVAPFSGASVDYDLPKSVKRQQVFGYAYIEGYMGELIEEIFSGLEVYQVISGRSSLAAAPIGMA